MGWRVEEASWGGKEQQEPTSQGVQPHRESWPAFQMRRAVGRTLRGGGLGAGGMRTSPRADGAAGWSCLTGLHLPEGGSL